MIDVMQSGKVRWGGRDIEVVYDPALPPDGQNFESRAFIAIDYAASLMSVSTDALLPELGESAIVPGDRSVVDFETFHRIVQWCAFEKNNPIAKSLLVAGYRDSVRSIALEQIGVPLSIDDRNAQIQRDRDEFYRQYAASISDAEWLAGNAIGTNTPIDFSKASHVAMFGQGWQPELTTRSALYGDGIMDAIEELMAKYGE